jgi:hypothetical protein
MLTPASTAGTPKERHTVAAAAIFKLLGIVMLYNCTRLCQGTLLTRCDRLTGQVSYACTETCRQRQHQPAAGVVMTESEAVMCTAMIALQ